MPSNNLEARLRRLEDRLDVPEPDDPDADLDTLLEMCHWTVEDIKRWPVPGEAHPSLTERLLAKYFAFLIGQAGWNDTRPRDDGAR